MLDETLTDEIHGWKWVAHSVVEGLFDCRPPLRRGPLHAALRS